MSNASTWFQFRLMMARAFDWITGSEQSNGAVASMRRLHRMPKSRRAGARALRPAVVVFIDQWRRGEPDPAA